MYCMCLTDRREADTDQNTHPHPQTRGSVGRVRYSHSLTARQEHHREIWRWLRYPWLFSAKRVSKPGSPSDLRFVWQPDRGRMLWTESSLLPLPAAAAVAPLRVYPWKSGGLMAGGLGVRGVCAGLGGLLPHKEATGSFVTASPCTWERKGQTDKHRQNSGIYTHDILNLSQGHIIKVSNSII